MWYSEKRGRMKLVEYLTLQTQAKEFDETAFSDRDTARVGRVASLNNTCQCSPKQINHKITIKKKPNLSAINNQKTTRSKVNNKRPIALVGFKDLGESIES